MNKVTIDDVSAEIERLATTYPDDVYVWDDADNWESTALGCSYIRGGTGHGTGCIFGQALTNLGVSVDTLRTVETDCINDGTDTSIGTVAPLVLDIPHDAVPQWWVNLQEQQDSRVSWDKAWKYTAEMRNNDSE